MLRDHVLLRLPSTDEMQLIEYAWDGADPASITLTAPWDEDDRAAIIDAAAERTKAQLESAEIP